MSKRNKSQPARMSGPMPPLEILEGFPIPRMQLVVVLRWNPDLKPACVALSAARFVSALQTADRKLRLAVDPAQSRATEGEVTLVFTQGLFGSEGNERLAKLAELVPQAIADFDEATLTRVEVVAKP